MVGRLVRILIAVAAATVPGCQPTPPSAAPATGDVANAEESPAPKGMTIPLLGGSQAAPPRPQAVYMIHLYLGTVEVPASVASGSEALWSYLDEEPVSLQSSVLGLNGIRVGLGNADVWPDIVRVLKTMTGQAFKSTNIQVLPGRATPIELKGDQPVQTIFTFHEDGTLSGQDFPKGDNLLTFSATLDVDNPSEIFLTAVPQIRTIKRFPRLVRQLGAARVVAKPMLFTFSPLRIQLRVKNGDIVVIGPGIQARRPSSVGHHFLTDTKEGLTHELVLVLRPRVVRVDYSPATQPAVPADQ
jgi:hypothetical protein